MKKISSILAVLLICLTLNAQEEIKKIAEEEYYISLTRKPELLKYMPTNTTIVDSKSIELLPTYTLTEVLENTISHAYTKYGYLGSASTVRIRHSTAEQVNFLINGFPIKGASVPQFLFAGNFLQSSVGYIDRIEILRGPSSAIYGANSVGGVVNIIPKIAKENFLDFKISGGSFQTQIYQLDLGLVKEPISLYSNINKTLTVGYRPNSEFDSSSYIFNLEYLPPIGKINLFTTIVNNRYNVPGPITWPTLRDKQLYHNHFVSLSYELDKIAIPTKISLLTNSHELSYYSPWSTSTAVGASHGLGLYSELPYDLSISYTSFLDSYKRTAEPQIENIPLKQAWLHSISIQKKLLYKNIINYIGLRYDYHTIFPGRVSPFISTVYLPKEELKLSLSYGTAWRAPSFTDLYWPYIDYVLWKEEGNPDLKPESGNGIEAGVEYKTITSKFLTNVFWRETTDLIRWYQRPDLVWTPSNVDKAKTLGVEFEITKKIIEGINIIFNYSHILNEVYKKGEEHKGYQLAAYSPKDISNLILFISPLKETTFAISINHIGERYEKDGESGKKLSPYTLANLKITQKISLIEFFFEIKNLLNEPYEVILDYPMPERSFHFGLKGKI